MFVKVKGHFAACMTASHKVYHEHHSLHMNITLASRWFIHELIIAVASTRKTIKVDVHNTINHNNSG